jgi:hypothetical protein
MILLIKSGASGYGAFREENISVVARFTTKRKALGYLRKLAGDEFEVVDGDQVATDDDVFQLVELDVATLPVDPKSPTGNDDDR